ncbi:FAD-dependent oxidoreductase [Catellatospora sp. TT07R-123]|nr:FAD-dependent oxidoreductase [Catellatospora sp. TT07R-123]
MRIMIMGAGVAGTVAAIACKQAGYDPVIYEAYDASAGLVHGVYLTVAVNGLDALRAVDAHRPVTAAGFPTSSIDFFTGTGRRLGAVPLGPVLPDGTTTNTIRRSDLYGGLYDEAVRRGVPVEHRKRMTTARELPGGGVRVEFADGTHAEGDLLVGADGIHSATRTAIDPAAPGPRYTGLGNVGGFARVDDVAALGAAYAMIWGKRCFFGYTVSPDGEVWWFANPPRRAERPRAELAAMTDAQVRAELAELLSVDRGPAARIVAGTPHELRISNQYDLPTVPRWRSGHMVVIGDAAHAVSPSSGQGASLAAEDAVTLAHCLREVPGIPAALAEYERRRRARVERVVAWGASTGSAKQAGPVARTVRDLVLPLIFRRSGSPQAMARMSWLFDHRLPPVPVG